MAAAASSDLEAMSFAANDCGLDLGSLPWCDDGDRFGRMGFGKSEVSNREI